MLHRSFAECVEELAEWASSDTPRLPTGFPLIDTRTEGGIAIGEMLMFTARSQVGKTWWLCNVVARNPGVPTVIFSLEMARRYIAGRIASVYCDVDNREIVRALKHHGTHPAIEKTKDAFPMLSIVDEPGLSLKQMSQALMEATEAFGTRPKLVGVDFLELIAGNPVMEAVSQVDRLAQRLKDFARKEDVALVVLHQVSRGSGQEGHQPLSITSGRYGGEQSADYIVGAYRPALDPKYADPRYKSEYESVKSHFYLQFLKTRGGPEAHPAGLRHIIHLASGRIVPLETSPAGVAWEQKELWP